MIFFPTGSSSGGGLLPRSAISGQIGLPDTFIVSGFDTANDGGQGAMYTKAANGTGAMALQDGSGQWYQLVVGAQCDIRWFGAKMTVDEDGRGIDDTAAFQNAISKMPSGIIPGSLNGLTELVIPAGTLWIRPGQISIPSDKRFKIRGAGMGSTFIRCLSGAYSGDMMVAASQQFTLSDLSFQGTFLATVSGGESDGLTLNAAYAKIRDVGFYYLRGNGLTVGKSAKSSGNHISGLQMRYIQGRGIYTTSNFQNYDSIITDCDIGITGKAGIYDQVGANNYKFNHPWGCGVETDISTNRGDCAGIWLGSNNNVLVGCQSETNRGDGVYITGSRNKVTSGDYWGNRYNGVCLDGANGNKISDNTIRRNGVDNDDGTSQTGNYAGVLIRGNSFSNSVDDNVIADDSVTLNQGAYTGYTPTYPYPGRTPAKRTTNYGVYYEAISGAQPYQNNVKCNEMKAETFTTSHAYGCNTFGGSPLLGLLFSVNCQWSENNLGTQGMPTYATNGGTLQVGVGQEVVFVSGTSDITYLTASYIGREITMVFQSAGVDVVHNGGAFRLSGGVNYVSTVNSTLTMRQVTASVWQEIGRS